MKIAYVRVSTEEQNEDRQIEKVRSLGVADRFIFVDKASGKNFDRPAYRAMKQVLREGDLLIVDSIDRLGRDYDGIQEEWYEITKEIKADIVALDMADLFDSRKFKQQGEIGKLLERQMLSLLAWVAEQERKKIKTRQREGIEIAKRQGKYKGRQPIKYDPEKVKEVYALVKGKVITNTEARRRLNMKKNKYYKTLKEVGLLSGAEGREKEGE